MIIFDLDGTLADCEHRRHFIEPPEDHCGLCYDFLIDKDKNKDFNQVCLCGRQPGIWKKDFKSFYEACDEDSVIQQVQETFISMLHEPYNREVQIWSGRCESMRNKTLKWLDDQIFSNSESIEYINRKLKMRPIGDNKPDDQLKERRLDDYIDSMGNQYSHHINFVFDSDPSSIRMWRRRGIFVFNCCQHEGEF